MLDPGSLAKSWFHRRYAAIAGVAVQKTGFTSFASAEPEMKQAKKTKRRWSKEKKDRVQKENARILVAMQMIDPEAFDEKKPLPLAINIHQKAQNLFPGASKKDVDRFFSWWCNRTEYHKAIVDGEFRYTLNETPPASVDGKISEVHRDNSRLKLSNRAAVKRKASSKKKFRKKRTG